MDGWTHFLYFTIFLFIGLIVAFFVRSPSLAQSIEKPNDQSTFEALKEAFKNKSYILLHLVFLYVVFILH